MRNVKKYTLPVIFAIIAIAGVARAIRSPNWTDGIIGFLAAGGSIITCWRAWQSPKQKREIKKTFHHSDWKQGNFESLLNPILLIENEIGRNVIVEIRKLGIGPHPREYPWEFLPDSSDIIIKRPMEANIGRFEPIEIRIREV